MGTEESRVDQYLSLLHRCVHKSVFLQFKPVVVFTKLLVHATLLKEPPVRKRFYPSCCVIFSHWKVVNHTHLASPLAFGTNSVFCWSSASCILPVKKLNRLSSEFDLLISGYIGIFTICIKSGQALSCYAQVTGWCLVHAFKLLLRLRGGRKHLRRQRKPSMVLGFKLIIEQNGKFCRLQTTYSIFFRKPTLISLETILVVGIPTELLGSFYSFECSANDAK